MKTINILMSFLNLLILISGYVFSQNIEQDYIKSFISHYEFSAEGRYAHEYHPFLLDRTAVSLDELENNLKIQGFNLSGRFVICGYEEQAFPSYYPSFTVEKINDERNAKNRVGWSLMLHNRFGFMTGFLFKDINYYAKYWFKNENPLFEHIDPDDVEIFDERASLFQKHSFGSARELLLFAQDQIIENFKNRDYKGVFNELIRFWDCMYNGKIKVGNRQVAGTQDIIFSIEYVKHLIRSELKLFNCFIGPDITYPIEFSLSQGKEATAHAQHFVEYFSKKLTPIDKKPTAYIFCSFVDGVGKSTMLGNIKNFTKYGSDVEKFERVDNSSSQLAELFQLKKDVFIADLPAQVSHFTYKPDGLVYVCVRRELEKAEIKRLQDFVRENQDSFIGKYESDLKVVKKEIRRDGYFADGLHDISKPEKTFLRNLVLLRKEEENVWIPFEYKGRQYLFNRSRVLQIRVLVPLGIVQSEGLKNIETEQMLFVDGVRFPFSYDFFLQNLIEKMKTAGVENIVFVDFISMYPRSSRENIRVNYLLQQMSLVDKQFDLKYSLYRDFVSGAELFALLSNEDSHRKILHSFQIETVVRLALLKILLENQSKTLDGFSLDYLTYLLEIEVEKMYQDHGVVVNDLSEKKLHSEFEELEEIYGLTKDYVNIQQFSFKNVLLFSHYVSHFFSTIVSNEDMNMLWEDPGNIIGDLEHFKDGYVDEIVKTDCDVDVRVLYRFDFACKDENALGPFLKTLRTILYAAFFNVLDADIQSKDTVAIEKEKFLVPAVFLKVRNNKIYVIQKIFNEWEGKLNTDYNKMAKLFNLKKRMKKRWMEFMDKCYLVDWNSLGTNAGIFGFDSNLAGMKKAFFDKSIPTFLLQKYQKEQGTAVVFPASKFYEKLKDSEMWKEHWEELLEEAKKNGKYKKQEEKKHGVLGKKKKVEVKKNKKKKEKEKKIKIYLGSVEHIAAARLLVRMLATLEMILKDPDTNIAVRFGNENDFKAALKLFEKTTLPKYYGIVFEHDLFNDYDYVEPYPSLQAWL